MIRGEGPRPCVSLWVGAYPGEEEVRRSRVWVGPAGRLFDSLLWKESILRDEIFLTNLRRTLPRKGDGGPYCELDAFRQELEEVEPAVVVTMGREAAQLFLGDVDLEAVHGICWRMPEGKWADLALNGTREPVVVPTYNPAFAMHDEEAYTYVAWDIGQAKRVIQGEIAPRQILDQYPSPRYSLGFKPYLHDAVYVDTEGSKKAPWCLSYACIPGVAHVILARDKEGLAAFADWIARRKRVVLHSSMYDLEVLRAMGIGVRDDQLADTKVMAYVTQVEPQGLKALGFRHAGMRMKSYDEVTSEYDFRQAMAYLRRVQKREWGKPDPVFEMRDGKPYVKKPQGLNTRIKSIFTAAAKGEAEEGETKVDPRKRWFKIEEEIRAPAEQALGEMPPFSLDLVPIEDAVFYAGRDADATCRVEGPLWDLVMTGDHSPVYRLDLAALPMVERMQANGILIQKGYFEGLYGFFTGEMDKIRKEIEGYNQGRYINPNSSPQTAALLFGRLRLPITKMTKGRKPSTADKVLEALRGRHPAVGLICDWRELATLRDKFAKQLPKYVDEDGRVRGKIRDTTVVSGRYSMSEPNLMAIPNRSKVGKKIRAGFIAGPGRKLCDADFDQIEMRIMAHLSRDEFLVRAFNEGRDVHSENARDLFEVSMEEVTGGDGPLLYRYPAKRIGFGIITGITELGLYDQMKLAGIQKYSVTDCARLIDRFFKVRPGIQRFITATRADAVRDGYVRDMGGRLRYLPGVYSRHPAVKEEALRQSHSHVISGSAQWVKKRALARIWRAIRDLPRGEVEPLLEVHDEILLEVVNEREKWVEALLARAMSVDSRLFSVPIKAKASFGPNWAAVKE